MFFAYSKEMCVLFPVFLNDRPPGPKNTFIYWFLFPPSALRCSQRLLANCDSVQFITRHVVSHTFSESSKTNLWKLKALRLKLKCFRPIKIKPSSHLRKADTGERNCRVRSSKLWQVYPKVTAFPHRCLRESYFIRWRDINISKYSCIYWYTGRKFVSLKHYKRLHRDRFNLDLLHIRQCWNGIRWKWHCLYYFCALSKNNKNNNNKEIRLWTVAADIQWLKKKHIFLNACLLLILSP